MRGGDQVVHPLCAGVVLATRLSMSNRSPIGDGSVNSGVVAVAHPTVAAPDRACMQGAGAALRLRGLPTPHRLRQRSMAALCNWQERVNVGDPPWIRHSSTAPSR